MRAAVQRWQTTGSAVYRSPPLLSPNRPSQKISVWPWAPPPHGTNRGFLVFFLAVVVYLLLVFMFWTVVDGFFSGFDALDGSVA